MSTQYKKKDFIYWMSRLNEYRKDKMYDIRRFFRKYYYKTKYVFFPRNNLKITTLPRHWMDRDEVLLHACFQILVDFVEKECQPSPYHQLIEIDIEKEMKCYVEWDEASKTSMRTSLEKQNEMTREILFLYTWWKGRKEIREKLDPMNELDSLPESQCDANLDCSEVVQRNEYGDPTLFAYKPVKSKEKDEIYRRAHEYEIKCEEEDEAMLIRLMKIRKGLWT
jgi:hypothetical protein